jgi:hypothetical protein
MATRPEHGHDFAVCAFDGGDPRGAVDGARRIAFREQFPAASARDRKRDAPIPDWRFAIRSEEQKHQIGIPNAALSRTPLGMVAKPGIIPGIRFARC